MAKELSIGEVAQRSGVAPSALRFYEHRGLIASARTNGNQRRYDRAVLRRIALIQAGRAAGHPARRDPRRAGGPAHEPDAEPTRLGASFEPLAQRPRRSIETLQALRERLTTCIGCGCLLDPPL